MAEEDEDHFWDSLENLGIHEVRRRLALNLLSAREAEIALAWLEAKLEPGPNLFDRIWTRFLNHPVLASLGIAGVASASVLSFWSSFSSLIENAFRDAPATALFRCEEDPKAYGGPRYTGKLLTISDSLRAQLLSESGLSGDQKIADLFASGIECLIRSGFPVEQRKIENQPKQPWVFFVGEKFNLLSRDADGNFIEVRAADERMLEAQQARDEGREVPGKIIDRIELSAEGLDVVSVLTLQGRYLVRYSYSKWLQEEVVRPSLPKGLDLIVYLQETVGECNTFDMSS